MKTSFRILPVLFALVAAAAVSRSVSAEPDTGISRGNNGGTFAAGTVPGERKTLTVGSIEYAFRWCPAGEFMMGSPDSEPDRQNNERLHPVTLTRGFWLLETEVTQEMWLSVTGSRPVANPADEGPSYPVYFVGWDECRDFCTKFSEQTGLSMSLPTEAEWEYACRAGSEGPYGGPGDLDSMGWYSANSFRSAQEVRQKEPNAWGLYDMHGNVWEWCSDTFIDDNYADSPRIDPRGPAEGACRVFRGGSWDDPAANCRSAKRSGDFSVNRYSNLGFRPAVAADGE